MNNTRLFDIRICRVWYYGFVWFERLQCVNLRICLGNWEIMYITNGTHDGNGIRHMQLVFTIFIIQPGLAWECNL